MGGEQAKIISTGPEVSFETKKAGPPSPLYIARDDRIFVRVDQLVAGGPFLINYRMLMPGGDVVPNSINVPGPGVAVGNFQLFDAAEGYLLDLCVTQTGGAGQRGLGFIQVGIMRGGVLAANVAHLLISDYLFDIFPLIWPGGAIKFPRGDEGSFVNIAIASPAAGAEFVDTVPANTVYVVHAVSFQFVTAAAVADRLVRLIFDINVPTIHQSAAVAVQPASLTGIYCGSSAGFAGLSIGLDFAIPIPQGLVLRPGHRIRSLTLNIQGADQFSSIRWYVERFIASS